MSALWRIVINNILVISKTLNSNSDESGEGNGIRNWPIDGGRIFIYVNVPLKHGGCYIYHQN